MLAEGQDGKFTIGANLYYNMLLCSDINYWLDQETIMYLEEFSAMQQFNIPLSKSIGETDYYQFVIFSAINEEYNACLEAQTKKNSNG